MALDHQKTEIANFIGQITINEPIRLLLTYCVGRLMLKNARHGKNLQDGIGSLLDVMHIADWLSVAVMNDVAWLKNTDAEGRPKKLMKFSSFRQITREADRAMLIEGQKSGEIVLKDGDEELIMTLADGYYAVRLMTSAALDHESGEMQHCIGAGGYDQALETRAGEFYSLRDTVGRAHATMEVRTSTREIIQLQGKQNRVPNGKYIELLLPMMKTMRLDTGRLHIGKLRFIDGDYALIDLHNLPDGTVINRHVYIESEGKIDFPTNLEVRGTLSLINCSNVRMPANLTVSGDLVLDRTDDVSKCENLKVGGSIRISESTWNDVAEVLDAGLISITSSTISNLANTLSVRRDLGIKDCGIRHFGTLDRVEGVLSLESLPQFEFVRPIEVVGHLHLPKWGDDHLPEALYGYSSLSIVGSSITTLPEGLVLRALDISDTLIEELPNSLEIKGRLTARGCSFRTLPKTVKIGGDMDISHSKCELLPEGLTLKGMLDVSRCDALLSLPNRLTVTRLKAVSASVRHIGIGLVVHREANFDRSDIVAIPSDAAFHGDVSARQCDNLQKVGKATFGGKLNLQGCGSLSLDEGLDIGGDLVLSEIDELPAGLCVCGDLFTEGDVAGIETAVIAGSHKRSMLSVALPDQPNSAPAHG
jgi:hypothetical protein